MSPVKPNSDPADVPKSCDRFSLIPRHCVVGVVSSAADRVKEVLDVVRQRFDAIEVIDQCSLIFGPRINNRLDTKSRGDDLSE